MIKSIEIEGYRLLDGFRAEMGPLTVVIGANGVGKSTLLDFFQFLAQCADVPLNTVVDWHWGMNSILNAAQKKENKLAWNITFEKPSNDHWAFLPLTDKQELFYQVVIHGDPTGRALVQHEVLRNAEPKKGKAEPLKHLEATPFRRQIFSRKDHKLVPFDEAILQPDKESAAGAIVENSSGPAAQEAALMLSQIRFLNEFPVPSSARMLFSNMAFYPGFDVTRYSALRMKAAEIKPTTILSQNGGNLGTVLHEILTRYDHRQAAADIREFLKSAYPAFEEILCETTFGAPAQVLVKVREKGMRRSMEMWELSDGMVRFLCLAAALLNPLPPPFIAIDEPEIGLHPRLLPIVADMIKTASEQTQVLITTHSPDLLNRFSIGDIAVMSRSDTSPKAGWHRPADRKTLVHMLKVVTGETIGDLHRSGELEAMA